MMPILVFEVMSFSFIEDDHLVPSFLSSIHGADHPYTQASGAKRRKQQKAIR
jgi:hypothetical protein